MGIWVLAAVGSGLSQDFWSLLIARMFVGAGKPPSFLYWPYGILISAEGYCGVCQMLEASSFLYEILVKYLKSRLFISCALQSSTWKAWRTREGLKV